MTWYAPFMLCVHKTLYENSVNEERMAKMSLTQTPDIFSLWIDRELEGKGMELFFNAHHIFVPWLIRTAKNRYAIDH